MVSLSNHEPGPRHQRDRTKGELGNMNSIVGKSTGIALLMAAAMLAALFAMGVFSATGVGAHDGHDGADDHTHDPATITSVTFSVPSDSPGTAPTDLGASDIEDGIYVYDVTVSSRAVTLLTVSTSGPSGVDSEITSPGDASTGDDGIAGHQVSLMDSYATTITVKATDSDADAASPADDDLTEQTYTINLMFERATAKTAPGSNQSLKVQVVHVAARGIAI